MEVTSVHNVIGWFFDKLRLETRRTYHYEKGNDVTVIERRTVEVTLYDRKGQEQIHTLHGHNIDLKG